MKIALINPPSLYTYGKINSGHNCSFPLGLGYIASYVKKHGHFVQIFDPEPQKMQLAEMWNQVKIFNPDIIGITAVTSNFMLAKEIAIQAKKMINCYVIMGGPHVSALPKSSLLSASQIDAVILREGEIPMLAIAEYFDNHKKIDFNQIPGAAYFYNNEYFENQSPALIDNLDSLPFPARDLVNIDLYKLHPQFARGKKSATILSSRGCPSSCTFCANHCMGRTFRANSAEYFVSELEFLINIYGIRHFHIVDDCFTIDSKRVSQICDLIIQKKLKITWFIFGRVNNLQKDELVKKMKKAGCIYVLLGIESGNTEVLKLMKKGTNLDLIRNCCKVLQKNKIKYFNSFIIGNEGDTHKTIVDTINFAKELKSVLVGFNIMIPFPGTEIFKKYFSDYDKPETNWNNWISVGDDIPYIPRQTSLSREELLSLTSLAYKRVYLSFGQLLRIMLFIKNPKIFINYLKQGITLFSQIFSWNKKSKEKK